MTQRKFGILALGCFFLVTACQNGGTGGNKSSSDHPAPTPSTPGQVTGRIGLSGETQYLKNNIVHVVVGDISSAQIPFVFSGTGKDTFENFDVQLSDDMKKNGWAVDSDSLQKCAPGGFTDCQVMLTYQPSTALASAQGTVSFSYLNKTGSQKNEIAVSYEAVPREQWASEQISGLSIDASKQRDTYQIELNPNVIVDQDANVYVIANDASFNHVIALNADGTQKWEYKVAIPAAKIDKKFTSLALVGADQIYAGASTNEIYAINKTTGKLSEAHTSNPFPADIFNPSNSPIFSSASGGKNGTLFATKDVLAGFTEFGTFNGPITAKRDISSLAVDNNSGLVLYGENGGMLKVGNLANGALKYQFDLAINPNANDVFVPSIFGEKAQPRKILFNNAYQIVMLKDLKKTPMDGCQGFTCVAPDWQVQLAQQTFASSAAAQSDGNVVYVQSASKSLLAYDSSKNNTGTDAINVKTIWEDKNLTSTLSPVATSALTGDVVLVAPSDIGNKTCAAALCGIVSNKTGADVRWSFTKTGVSKIVSKPVLSPDGRTAYVVDDQNVIHAINM